MRAVLFDDHGDQSVLRLGERPDPPATPSHLRIRVVTSSVNPVDWKIIQGDLDPLLPTVLPATPGWDVAGVVEDVGPDTPEFTAGDEVLAYARKETIGFGAWADLVTVPAWHVARKPAGLGWAEAGALPLAGLTAARILDRLGADRPAGTMLIHAASGGVGHLLVQLAVAGGWRVIGTASEENHEYLRSLGAEPVAYGDGLADRVRALAPGGVDAVADLFGKATRPASVELLAGGGALASVIDPGVMKHGGHWLWVRPDGPALQDLADRAARGDLSVRTAEHFGLERIADAVAANRTGHAQGKVVIDVSEPPA